MKYYLAPLAVAVLLVAGCSHSKEEAAAPPCDCPALPDPGIGLGPRVTGADTSYDYPCFNPRNPREVVFYRVERNNFTNYGLYTANLDTHQKRFIRLGNEFGLQVRWGPTGWIALSMGSQIWKLKANGDSLTQLTFGTPHYQPQWSPDGQRLVCQEPDSPGAPLIIIDKNGRKLATLNGFPTQYCESWSPDGARLLVRYGTYGQGYGLGVYELATNRVELVAVTEVAGSTKGLLYGAAWLPDSRNVIWATGTGLYAADTQTHQVRQLHTGCDTRIYLNPDVSADGRSILVSRVDQKSIDNGQGVYQESNLWLMDIDGGNERKLVF